VQHVLAHHNCLLWCLFEMQYICNKNVKTIYPSRA
jgi:hypothetical protein